MNSTGLYFVRHFVRLLPDTRCFRLKRFLYRICGVKIGINVRICSSAIICGDGELLIGDNTWIGHESFISSSSTVTIGADVNIAPRVFIGTGTHEIDFWGPAIAGRGYNQPIVISDGVWLCSNCVILPGVVVGRKALVAAGAVVTKNIPDKEMWGGIPARIIRNMKNE